MGVTKDQVESSLTSKLKPSHLVEFEVTCSIKLENSMPGQSLLKIIKVIIDTSGGFAIEIVSEQFEGKRLLKRHRIVNSALEEEMKQIHALSIKKALTPDQREQQQEAEKSKSDA